MSTARNSARQRTASRSYIDALYSLHVHLMDIKCREALDVIDGFSQRDFLLKVVACAAVTRGASSPTKAAHSCQLVAVSWHRQPSDNLQPKSVLEPTSHQGVTSSSSANTVHTRFGAIG